MFFRLLQLSFGNACLHLFQPLLNTLHCFATLTLFVRPAFVAVYNEHTNSFTIALHFLHTGPWRIRFLFLRVDPHCAVNPFRFVHKVNQLLGLRIPPSRHAHQETVIILRH